MHTCLLRKQSHGHKEEADVSCMALQYLCKSVTLLGQEKEPVIIQLFSTLDLVLDFKTLFLFLKQSGEKSHWHPWSHKTSRGACQVPGNSIHKVSRYHGALLLGIGSARGSQGDQSWDRHDPCWPAALVQLAWNRVLQGTQMQAR